MGKITFAHSRPFTIGVELELQILDRYSLDLVSKAPALLADLPECIVSKVSPEFICSIIEVQSGVCSSAREAAADLRKTISLLEDVADSHNCLLYCASLHPFAEPAAQQLVDSSRYRRIMEELQFVGRQFISQGMHVHIGLARREMVIPVCEVLQVYLPVLLGISGSSPYFRGEDTGFSSYRSKLFEALPLAGIFAHLGSWQAYEDEVNMLRQTLTIRTVKDLWWDVRPSPDFGTVEVRICDLPARFVEIFGLTTMMQSLVAVVVDGMVVSRPVSYNILQANKWQAARYGLKGRFHDPLGLLITGRTQEIKEAAGEMLQVLRPCFDIFGDYGLAGVENILATGNSADRQRELVREHGCFVAMIKKMRKQFWDE